MVLFYTHTKFKKNRRDRGGFDSLNAHGMTLNLLFTSNELDSDLVKIKSRSTGPDNIHNEMLANLSKNNKLSLLLLFNALYQLSFVPEDWKRVIVVPLPKTNKPLDDVSSYRPISLTSCLCKLFERIITNRISWCVESKNLICPNQASFRKRRCTTDHLVNLDLDMKRSFKVKRPIDAEVILQPYLDKVAKWGRKFQFKFSAAKSSAVSFTRSYKPRDDPFIHQCPPHPKRIESEISRTNARLKTYMERPHSPRSK